MTTIPPAIDQVAAELQARLASGQPLDAALDATLDQLPSPAVATDVGRRARDVLWASAQRAAAEAAALEQDPRCQDKARD